MITTLAHMLDATQDAGLGWGGMRTFLALAHMLDATQDAGLGYVGCYARCWVGCGGMICWMLRKMLGWGGGDDNVPCTCTHVGCYARCWVGVGGMITTLALAHMLDATQRCWVGVGGMITFSCTCTHVGCYTRGWVGGMKTFLALAHMLDIQFELSPSR